MMGTAFWSRRFLLVFVSASAIIAGAQMLKGHTLGYAVFQGTLWLRSHRLFLRVRAFISRAEDSIAPFVATLLKPPRELARPGPTSRCSQPRTRVRFHFLMINAHSFQSYLGSVSGC